MNVDEIRAALAAASPGPWRWRGNTDYHSLQLGTWSWRSEDGRGAGFVTVMDFVRAGMQGAQPRFRDDGLMMVKGESLVEYEVGKRGAPRNHPSVYRADIVDIVHPDAHLIAHAPTWIAELLDENDALRKELAEARDVVS